jgi:multiple sugar transport system permease protein
MAGPGAAFAAGYLYLIAPLAIVTVVTVFPLVNTLFLSFQDYILTNPAERTYFDPVNYRQMWQDPLVRRAVSNTVIYTASTVIASLAFGLGIALLVNGLRRGRRFFRTLFTIEMLLTPVVVGVIWRFLFNYELGIINHFVTLLGFRKVEWLSKPALAMFSVVLVDVWQWTPYVVLVVSAGLDSLPLEPFESARIDGANVWQIFRYLTLPFLTPVLIIAATFRFIWAFRGFDHIYTLTQGGPGNATETLAMSVWRMAFSRMNIGMGSAISMVMFLIMIVVSSILLRSLAGRLQA